MKLSVPNRLKGKKLYTEIWKPIRDYEGLYEVSNMGRVRSLDRYDSNGHKLKGRILKGSKYKGYSQIGLHKDGKCKTHRIHRLVALHFVDGYFEGAEVDHINCVRDDNRAENLRFVTSKENSNNELTRKHNSEAQKGKQLSEETKAKMSGRNNHNYGKGYSVYCVELNKTYPNAKQCAEELGLWATNIGDVCKGKLKQTGGYHFIYCSSNKYKNYLVKNKVA